jgi:predicted permease
MSTLWQDLRFAARSFGRSPGFTAAAVLSLAIGIGANTALFSVVYALLVRPLPYPDADRLVILWNRSPGLNIPEDWFSTAQYFDIRNGHPGFEQLAIATGGNGNLTGYGDPERVGVIRVSSNLLPMLGVKAAAGRLFSEADDRPGAAPAALLSHGLWTRRFDADPQVLGRTIALNGQAAQVAGVLPRSFDLPREVMPTLGGAERADILLPLPLSEAAPRNRGQEDYNIIGRRRPGVSTGEIQAGLDAITARLRREFPDLYPPNGGLTFSAIPLLEQVVGDVRRTLYVLLGAVGFVLLIACANAANLLLSRAAARGREAALRSALGAGRARLVRQLLAESVLLALAGGAAGVLLAVWSLDWIRTAGRESIPRLPAIGIDGAALAFTFLLSLLTGVVFGLAPAWRLASAPLIEALKDAARGSAGMHALWGRGRNLRQALVVAEVALSVVLLAGAGLLIRSFTRLLDVAPGFEPAQLLTFELNLSGSKYPERPSVAKKYRELWQSLEQLPGVESVGLTTNLPLSRSLAWGPITVEGRTPAPGEAFINADERVVAGRYFETMRIPLLRGRLFDERDTPDKPLAVLVDERMARTLWPGEDPLGKRLRRGGVNTASPWLTVVGVVGRVKHESLDSDPRIAMYLAHPQFASRTLYAALRTGPEPSSLTSAVKEQLRALDPDLPLYGVRTMDERAGESLARRRFAMLLLTLLAVSALALAALGVYGVMSCLVRQGLREIGIRAALGASSGGLLRLVLRQGMTLAAAGALLGLAAALVLTRSLGALLYGVPASDVLTFALATALLLAVALAACAVPAWRAARTDPALVLRDE